MTLKEILLFLAPIFFITTSLCLVPFLMYVVFPFFQSFSPEKRFEKYIDDKCIQGNEVAILIRREGVRSYLDKDYKLIKEAIEGNEYAIKALKLDAETLKKKNC